MTAILVQSSNRKWQRQSGSALIAVLWLAAALAAVAFSLAATVRTEIGRAEADSEGLRTYYLARGAIDRSLLWITWGPQYRRPDGTPLFYEFPMPRLQLQFPSGTAIVELIPESSKYNINSVTPEDLYRLLSVLGAGDARSRLVTAALLDWRSGSSAPGLSSFDRFYLAQPSSFHSPHASFRELEELLLVRGMTSDLYYGNYTRDAEGHALWHAGLRDCLSTVGSNQIGFDINTAEPAVLASVGVDPFAVSRIVAIRSQRPIRTLDEVSGLLPPAAAGRLRVGGGSVATVRATARLRLPTGQLSDLKRSVAALVKFDLKRDPQYTTLRWYDNAQSSVF